MSELNLEIKDIDGCSDGKVISVIGFLNSTTVDILLNNVMDIIKSGCYKLVFDFSELKYIGSAGLGSINSFRDKCIEKGGTVCITGVDENVMDTIQLVGLTRLINLYNTVEEAIEKEINREKIESRK